MTENGVSVVVRNRNEASALRMALSSVRQQRGVAYEIIGVDNESTDPSRDVWRDAKVDRLLGIARADYAPGRALNLGIAASRFDIVLILSAHSVLLHADFLQTVLAGFVNGEVAGARCIQAGSVREATHWHESFELRPGASLEEILQNGLNCAGSAIRRSVWEVEKFDDVVEMVEDKLWTQRVLARGYRLRRVPAIYGYFRTVTAEERIRRSYRESVAVSRAFGVKRPPANLLGLLSALTLGGARRYWRDVGETWLSYRLNRAVGKDARRAPRIGSTQ